MAYVISDACISCGACEGTCPAGAISEGDGQYVIDADTCMECGACADVQQELSARNNFQVTYIVQTTKKRCIFMHLFFVPYILLLSSMSEVIL